jgi:tRNA-specific 2-thiouridylase
MLTQRDLTRTLFPIGHMTKIQVREKALALGLRTAAKPDSQDVCFITDGGGRVAFLGSRIPFRSARVVDAVDGTELGEVESLEMVTLGQRRGIGLAGGGPKRYVVGIDHDASTVMVGDESLLQCASIAVRNVVWAHQPVVGPVAVQCSAHGEAMTGSITANDHRVSVIWDSPQRRVAPGQSVVFYDATNCYVLGGGIAV